MLRIIFTSFFFFITFLNANLLQESINNAKEGSILKLPKGVYKGSIVINKPISIIGKEDGVIIDGEQQGTVIQITSPFVTIKNLTITGSGDRHDTLDSAIKITNSNQSEISGNIIKLFNSIEAIADDLTFGIPNKAAFGSPSILFNNVITISTIQ